MGKAILLGAALVMLSGCGGYATPKKVETAKKVCRNRGGYESVYIQLINDNITFICNDGSALTLDESNQELINE